MDVCSCPGCGVGAGIPHFPSCYLHFSLMEAHMTDRNPKEPEVSKTCTTCKYDALPAHAPECQGCSVMGWSNPEEKWTPKDPEADPVNNPAHYTKGIETYQYISSWGMGFAQGNAIKYLTRYQDKGKPLEDLKKARWYLDQLIKAEEAKL